jgi:hypothetical protein
VEQLAIVVTGGIAIWLANDPRESWRKWASVVGLAGQPFWFFSLSGADQWGIMILAAIYTVAWARGFHASWRRGAWRRVRP